MGDQTVLYSRSDNVAIITLNRPERLNAINGELLRELNQLLKATGEDREVASVILTGAGRAFCSGEDLKETSAGKSIETWTQEVDGLQDVQRIIMGLGKPLIAAVQGYAVGGGCEFAMSCDIRIAAQDAMFGFPETALGNDLDHGGVPSCSRSWWVWAWLRSWYSPGIFIDAKEALRDRPSEQSGLNAESHGRGVGNGQEDRESAPSGAEAVPHRH